jgi:hypothetical protein
MKWAGYVSRTVKRVCYCKKTGRREAIRIPKRRWVDNIKMDPGEKELVGMDWIDIIQDMLSPGPALLVPSSFQQQQITRSDRRPTFS